MSKKNKILPHCSKVVEGHNEPMLCPVAIDADENKERYNKILKYSFEEIYVFDAVTYKFIEVSVGAINNLGYTLDELKHLTSINVKKGLTIKAFEAILAPLIAGDKDIAKFSSVIVRKDGSEYDGDIRLQYVPGDNPVFIAMLTDVTERNLYEKELKALAFRDPGTNLYNRRYFLEHMEGTINHVNRMHSSIGLVLIDMDDFSKVNNKYGHLAGDEIIVKFASKIRNIFSRKTDVVARYGGDEFVVMCIDNTEEDLVKKCKELIELLNVPCYYEGNEILQTASIGICLRTGNCHLITSENLIRGADEAMYQVKGHGKNAVKVCESDEI